MFAIEWIMSFDSLILIHRIVIYIVDIISAIQVLNSCGQKVYYAQQLSNILNTHSSHLFSLIEAERDMSLIYRAFFAVLWLNERHI